jgi:hypothetical protein
VKVKMLLDGDTPKVPPATLKRVIQDARMEVTKGRADLGLVVGGDGRFSKYGRTEDMPLLFVGVRAKGATGSKAHLARTTFDELPDALERIRRGEYTVDEQRRLGVLRNGRRIGEVFTDVYLQRGSESTCIRYRLRVSGKGVSIEESAIGDGVVISTQAGASGYYSYPDRIKGDWMDPSAFASIGSNQVGICHISPTFTERSGSAQHPLRYTVPWGSRIDTSLFRKADARLYGITDGHAGIRVLTRDVVSVVPGKKVTKIISV